ncbi:MAG: ribonuclease HII [Dehalococcoidaceae bacterium]|nr:ribonuclease HII [Dehalococcoidaceae bacterium]
MYSFTEALWLKLFRMDNILINRFKLENSFSEKNDFIAGIDEVGRGALAGPVVAGIVIFQRQDFSWIDQINDSKLLSKINRETLANLIRENTIWSIGSVSNHVIDQIGIEASVSFAMELAIEQLEIKPSILLVDGNVKLPSVSIRYENIIKGDQKSASIAAASIIAKVYRDAYLLQLDSIFPLYGFASNAGYGTKTHIDTLKSIGPATIHRNSFKPVKDLV